MISLAPERAEDTDQRLCVVRLNSIHELLEPFSTRIGTLQVISVSRFIGHTAERVDLICYIEFRRWGTASIYTARVVHTES